MKRVIEITEEGFVIWELGIVDPHTKKEWAKECIDKFDRLTPNVKEVKFVDINDTSSSSREEEPQDYKSADYLLLHQK